MSESPADSAPSTAHQVVWTAPLDGSTNVERFMVAHDIATFDALLARSIAEPEWFWGAAVEFLGLPFATPYEHVLDLAGGIPWARWFTGGTTNLASMCVDRWAHSSPTATAIVWEGEDGEVRELTYETLGHQVDALAALLQRRGVGEGDTVGIYLPMVPEVVAACMAVAPGVEPAQRSTHMEARFVVPPVNQRAHGIPPEVSSTSV